VDAKKPPVIITSLPDGVAIMGPVGIGPIPQALESNATRGNMNVTLKRV